mgnify:CR=1 FL=1
MNKIFTIMLFAAFLLNACGGKKDQNVAQLISGTSSKTWYAVKETNATGGKETLTDDEKEATWVFFMNNTMTITDRGQIINGNWSYDPASKSLIVTPGNSTTARTFRVEDIDDKEMELKAGDGSELKLKAKAN